MRNKKNKIKLCKIKLCKLHKKPKYLCEICQEKFYHKKIQFKD